MRRQLVAAALAVTSVAPAAAQDLAVYAAGSLRVALTEVSAAFEREQRTPVKLTFGPSGLLKDRLAGGEAAGVFASANLTHPQDLANAGRAEPVRPFARNALCGLAVPGFSLQGRSLAQRMLDADVRVATSTPKADPAGDYAFQMFDRIEASGAAPAGSAVLLRAKALQLTGGPNSPVPAPGRSLYGALMAAGQAEVFITYCTNAAEARREHPQLQTLPVPEAINVSASYGITLLRPAGAAAQAYVAFVLSPTGQAILASHGFSPP
jgi:molybdate transport system substrate-binding protein